MSKTKILVVHDMIGNKPLYPGHDYTRASNYLAVHKEFDIILCGDYHYSFRMRSKDGRVIVNTGCLLRLTRDERDMTRTPHFWIYDTDKASIQTWKKVIIPHDPYEKVFDLSEKREVQIAPQLDEFIEKLKRKEKIGSSYIENLHGYYNNHDVSDPVKNLISEVLS